MRALGFIQQLQNMIARNKQLSEELAQESPLWALSDPHDPDPIVYLSIGPTCIPITVELESIGTLYGALEGVSLSAKLDLPPELNQKWFELRDEIIKHLEKEKAS